MLIDDYIELPGLTIRTPNAQLIATGKKTIETRPYSLPKDFLGRYLYIIETQSVDALRSRIIGVVKFDAIKTYEKRAHWIDDYNSHLVRPNDPEFGWITQPKFGWVVSEAFLLKSSFAAPDIRVVRYTENCRVPADLFPKNSSLLSTSK